MGLKEKNCQLGILIPAKMSFKNPGKKKKSFSDEEKLGEFSRPALKEMLKGVFLDVSES